MTSRAATAAASLLVALACGGGASRRAAEPSAPQPTPAPTPAAPIDALPPNVWSWVPFPESRCDDGSATGLGISPGDGPDLLVYLDGGGACWDFATCAVLNTSRHGPWAEPEFRARAGELPGSLFDRDHPTNPFRSFSFVFVPYCTGDVHSGDRRTTYVDPQGGTRTLEHRGRANAAAFLERIAATFPSPERLVVAGSSAGGYGTLLHYDAFRRRWPAARGFAIDDAGPALRGLPAPALREAWWAAWGTPEAFAPWCPRCADDVSAAWITLSTRWPGDRFAFLSSTRDETMRGYLSASATEFEAALDLTAREVLAPLENVRWFFVADERHTMLNDVGAFTAAGTPLRAWLADMLEGDPAWRSRGP